MILVSPRFGHPHSQNPSDIANPLAIWVGVRVTGDAHITRVLGMGMPKTRKCPNHCDSCVTHSPL